MGFLKDLWNFNPEKKPSLFYGDLTSLNSFYDVSKASPEILKEMQIANLKNAYASKGASYETLNSFLKDLLGTTQGTDDDLFAKLTNGINKGLDEFRSAEFKENKNWIQEKKDGIYFNELDDIISQINALVNSTSGEEGIPAPSLEPIKNAIRNHRKMDFINAKGQYLEDIGAWIMQRAGLAGFTTGAWKAEDKFFGENFEASIIEDAMGLILGDGSKFKGDTSGNFLKLKIQNYSKMSVSNKIKADTQLQDWVNSVKELNGASVLNGVVTIGSNISSADEFANLIRLVNNNSHADLSLSVSLSSDLHKQIRELSVNIQGKSNIERHLANAGNRSLYHMSGGEYDKIVTFSKTYPVTSGSAVSDAEFNEKYEEFAAYANYNLSKNINNTVYGRNEFYITKEGFSDLATLMEQRGFYIRIQDSALSYAEFLENSFRTIYS